MESDVAELVRRAQQGEAEAFGALVGRFRDAVYGLCYHRCGDFDLARDLAQEAFVRAYQHLGQLSERPSFPRWLRRIAERVCIDWRRTRRPEEPLERARERPAQAHDDLAALRLTVQQGLAALPEAQRLAVTLFHINGYGYREIAEFLGTSETTVKARLDAGRARLRGALAEAFEGALRAQRPPERFREEVMMRVTQVQMKESVDDLTGRSDAVLVLGDEQRAIPLNIGAGEAWGVRLALGKAETPRPFTYDTFLSSLAAFGIALSGVRINRYEDRIYYAELELRRGKVTKRIDCRPSDAVNLALRADVPVEVDEVVLKEAGLSAAEAERQFGALDDFPVTYPGMRVLHEAAEAGAEERVREVLAAGADANERNLGGVTALQIAVVRQHDRVVKALLEAGAEVNSTDARGRTPLHHAAASGHKGVVEALLSAGANPAARDAEGRTPRQVAGTQEVATLLGPSGG